MSTSDYLKSLQNDLNAIKNNLSDGGMEIESSDNFSNIALKTNGIQIGGGGETSIEYLGKYSDFDTEEKAINFNDLEIGKLYIVSEMSNVGVTRTINIKATTKINNVEQTFVQTLRNTSLKSMSGILYLIKTAEIPENFTSTMKIGEYCYDVIYNNGTVERGIQDLNLANWGISTSGVSVTLFSSINESNQTFYGTKTFVKIPKQSTTTAPTQNTEFTNKLYVDNKITTYTGYDSSKTQVLKNVNGTITWVNE